MEAELQGWYVDPFGIHEGRWFSEGRPTALVLDGTQNSSDSPPTETYDGPLTRIEGRPFPAHFDDDDHLDPEAWRARVTGVVGRMGDGAGL